MICDEIVNAKFHLSGIIVFLTMKAPFSKGDRVRLKPGGPIMAIRAIEMTRERHVWRCNCRWWVREGSVEVEC